VDSLSLLCAAFGICDEIEGGDEGVAVFVDSDLFEIMNGPAWENR